MIPQLSHYLRSWFAAESKTSAVLTPPSIPPPPQPWFDTAHQPSPLPVLQPLPLLRPSLTQLARLQPPELPLFVRESAAARKYIDLLGPLDWEHFPARHLGERRRGPKPYPDAPVVAAFLVKLDKGLQSMGDLRDHLIEQPALTWVLGFPLLPSEDFSYGFDVDKSLPTHRHLSRLLRKLPNAQMQFLLKGTVQLLNLELPEDLNFGDKISLDTKHIIAWAST